jgi:hypothetical protein
MNTTGLYFLQHIIQTISFLVELSRQTQKLKKRICRDPTKRESKRFHSTWVKQRRPAVEDVMKTVGGVAVAMEAR